MDVFAEYALLFVVAAPLAYATVFQLVLLAAGARDRPAMADSAA